MIKVPDIQLDSTAFSIMNVDGKSHLTAAASHYDFRPEDGGVTALIKVELEKGATGYLCLTQICTYHSLFIKKKDGVEVKIELTTPHKDTELASDGFYTLPIKVENGVMPVNYITMDIRNEVFFRDTLFIELYEDWEEVKYDIVFDTYLSYRKNNNAVSTPVLQFKWKMTGEARSNNGKWTLEQATCPSVQELQDSVVYSSENDLPESLLYPVHLPQLADTVTKLRIDNGVW
jgi:hypothetical protein